MPNADFYAVISKSSRYVGQDDGRPFPVTFVPESDGYIWHGLDNRYSSVDVILLNPSPGPDAAAPNDFGDPVLISLEQARVDRRAWLAAADWFEPMPHQPEPASFTFIGRDGTQV